MKERIGNRLGYGFELAILNVFLDPPYKCNYWLALRYFSKQRMYALHDMMHYAQQTELDLQTEQYTNHMPQFPLNGKYWAKWKVRVTLIVPEPTDPRLMQGLVAGYASICSPSLSLEIGSEAKLRPKHLSSSAQHYEMWTLDSTILYFTRSNQATPQRCSKFRVLHNHDVATELRVEFEPKWQQAWDLPKRRACTFKPNNYQLAHGTNTKHNTPTYWCK